MKRRPNPQAVLEDLIKRLNTFHNTFDKVFIVCDRSRWLVRDCENRDESAQERLERAALHDALVCFLTDTFDPTGFSMEFRIDTASADRDEDGVLIEPDTYDRWKRIPSLLYGDPSVELSPFRFLGRLDLLRPLAAVAPDPGGDILFEGRLGSHVFSSRILAEARDVTHAVHCMQFDTVVTGILRRETPPKPSMFAVQSVKRIEKDSVILAASASVTQKILDVLPPN